MTSFFESKSDRKISQQITARHNGRGAVVAEEEEELNMTGRHKIR